MTDLPFITTTDVVNYLGRGGTADAGMIIAVDSACDICRDVAEQRFNFGTSTIKLDGTGTDALLLPEAPVTSAGTVVVDGGTVTDYSLNDNGVLFRTSAYRSLSWPVGRQNVQVTYVHGYVDADIPRSVRMVALSVAARLVIQGPVLQEAVGEVSARYAVASTDLTANELRILRKYKRAR